MGRGIMGAWAGGETRVLWEGRAKKKQSVGMRGESDVRTRRMQRWAGIMKKD